MEEVSSSSNAGSSFGVDLPVSTSPQERNCSIEFAHLVHTDFFTGPIYFHHRSGSCACRPRPGCLVLLEGARRTRARVRS